MSQQNFLHHAALTEARALHQARRLPEALARLDRLTAGDQPQDAAALALRGDILTDMGRLEEAVGSYDRAIALAPDWPEPHDFRGIALAQLGRLDEAADSLQRAIALQPDNANALNNLSLVLGMAGRLEEALDAIERTIALQPGFYVAHNSHGNTLVRLGRDEEAEAAYGRALDLAPDFDDARLARAACRRRLGRTDKAAADVDALIARAGTNVEALGLLAQRLQASEDYESGLAVYERIAALQPLSADAHFACAMMCDQLRRADAAQAYYERSLAVDPNMIGALNNIAALLAGTARPAEALPYYDRAIALAPDNAMLHFNRALARKDTLDWEGSVAGFERTLALDPDFRNAAGMRLYLARHLCDWTGDAEARARLAEDLRAGKPVSGAFPLLSLYDDNALIRDASAPYVAREHGVAAPRLPARVRSDERIHVGYFSGDFREHPLMHLIGDLFVAHDRSRVIVSAFSHGLDTGDPWRRKAETTVDHFHDVCGYSHGAIATLSRANGVDIAVDLTGLSQGGRLGVFAERAAPVQVSWLGYVGTMGADFYDYILADAYAIPEEEAANYAEAPAWLPFCFQANAREREVAATVPTRTALGLPEGAFVYCCFNQSYKITPEMFARWMRILAAVPASVLWLWSDHPATQANLRRTAGAAGIDPARLVFAGRIPIDEHLARLPLADLFLDTMPYNAGTTASDALRMGVPVLTLSGRTMSARMAGSLVTAIGLPELATERGEDYEAKAIALGSDPAAAADLKARLAQALPESALFDSGRLARDLEQLYAEMVARAERGEPATPLRL